MKTVVTAMAGEHKSQRPFRSLGLLQLQGCRSWHPGVIQACIRVVARLSGPDRRQQ